MKIKVSEATSTQLDWLYESLTTGESQPGACYTTDWAQGGPILERECIDMQAYGAASEVPKNPDYWEASIYLHDEIIRGEGPTPLIAAMRCFVVSTMGEEVEVPDELL